MEPGAAIGDFTEVGRARTAAARFSRRFSVALRCSLHLIAEIERARQQRSGSGPGAARGTAEYRIEQRKPKAPGESLYERNCANSQIAERAGTEKETPFFALVNFPEPESYGHDLGGKIIDPEERGLGDGLVG